MILLTFTFGSGRQWKAAVQQGSIFLAASQQIPTAGNALLSYAAQMESREHSKQTPKCCEFLAVFFL